MSAIKGVDCIGTRLVIELDPVVRRAIIVNPGLNFYLGFLFLLFTSIFPNNFLLLFTAFSH